MNDTLVVYESKYGGTVTYIDLLAHSLPFDVMRLRELKRQRSLPHRTVVLASGVYAGRIAAAAALASVTGSCADWTDSRYLDPLIRALRG